MKFKSIFIVLLLLLVQSCNKSKDRSNKSSDYWLTTSDKSVLFEEIKGRLKEEDANSDLVTIEVDTEQTFQMMDGFGFSLTQLGI